MNHNDFLKLQANIFDEVRTLTNTKGKDYADESDSFSNFKKHGILLGLPPELVWAVYAGKHWDAILTYCKKGRVESETLESRILDLITYLTLLYAHITDTS